MAYIQKITPPPNRIMNFSLKDFSGGMNNRSDQIQDNEGSVVKNLMFADDTVLETRYGQKYYSEKDYGGEILFIDEFKPYRDEPILVVATKDKIFFGDVEVTISGKPTGISHLGHYYFADGEKLRVYAKFNQKWDKKNPVTDKEFAKVNDKGEPIEGDHSGTYLKIHGTSLEGYHVYEVVSPADGFTQLGTEHTQGVTNINYTKKEVYYEPCKNEFTDHLKGANVVPGNLKYVVSHQDRIFASGSKEDDDNVFMSDKINPLYFPVGLPMQVPPTSDKVVGMHVFDNSVIVGREKDIYAITGETNNPDIGLERFKLKKLNTHTGFASHDAVSIAHNYMMFLGSDGNVYGLQNARTYERDLATIILSRTIDLEKHPIEVNKEDYASASSCFFNDELHLSIGDKVLVYNYRHMSWVMYTDLEAKCWYGIGDDWIWGRPEGRLAMFDKETFLDFGLPYQSLWYSKIFDMEDANSFKQFREFFLVAHTFPDQFSDIYVTFEVDYAEVRDRAVISNQLSIWGKSLWGDRFINRNINESLPFVIGRRGRNIRFKITNGYYKDGEIDTRIDEEGNVDNLLNYPGKKDGTLVMVLDEDRYYLYMDKEWIPMEDEEMNQRMKIYQVNGDYEKRGKR